MSVVGHVRSRRVAVRLVAACLTCAAGTVFSNRFVDDAKRTVPLPASVTRAFAAGAPAEVLLYSPGPGPTGRA